jgi:hypothetical protein
MYRGVGDTDGFLFLSTPDNQRLLRGRSLGEEIQDEVGNVIKAAAAVMELPGVGMIAQHSGATFLISSFEDRCPGVKRSQRPVSC